MTTPNYDLVITGGTVIDGTGADPIRADVGIIDERIAAVGDLADADAGTRIDATNRVVSPGFIDVHSHDDAAAITDPSMRWKTQQGVTSVIVGNCGFGAAPHSCAIRSFSSWDPSNEAAAPWGDYHGFRQRMEAQPPATNLGFLVGHGTARLEAVGEHDRPASATERATMSARVAEGLEAGALGLSTGLIYVPGRFAPTDEITELARLAADASVVYTSHLRDEGDFLLEAVDEALAIGNEAGVAVQLSHHKAYGARNYGKVRATVESVHRARANGQEVTVDVYPYTASSTMLSAMLTNRFLETGPGHDEALIGPHDVTIVSAPGAAQWEGRTLDDIARQLESAPVAAARHIVGQLGDAAMVVVESMSDDDIAHVMAQDFTMIGSDGVLSPGKPHPRLYGTFPRVLGRYVRAGVFSLPEAVRRMTSLAADTFAVSDRGRVAAGACADLVVFDPTTIADTATFEQPDQAPLGIDEVIVNGRRVVSSGAASGGARPGKVLTPT